MRRMRAGIVTIVAALALLGPSGSAMAAPPIGEIIKKLVQGGVSPWEAPGIAAQVLEEIAVKGRSVDEATELFLPRAGDVPTGPTGVILRPRENPGVSLGELAQLPRVRDRFTPLVDDTVEEHDLNGGYLKEELKSLAEDVACDVFADWAVSGDLPDEESVSAAIQNYSEAYELPFPAYLEYQNTMLDTFEMVEMSVNEVEAQEVSLEDLEEDLASLCGEVIDLTSR